MAGKGQGLVRLGIQRSEDGVGGDPIVEPRDECLEEGQPADGREQCLVVRGQRALCQDLPSVWTDGA